MYHGRPRETTSRPNMNEQTAKEEVEERGRTVTKGTTSPPTAVVEAITLLSATSETLTPPPVGDDSSRVDPSADPQSLQI